MKPRIIKFMGIWHCRHPAHKWAGMGYTPKAAYIDWLAWNDGAPA